MDQRWGEHSCAAHRSLITLSTCRLWKTSTNSAACLRFPRESMKRTYHRSTYSASGKYRLSCWSNRTTVLSFLQISVDYTDGDEVVKTSWVIILPVTSTWGLIQTKSGVAANHCRVVRWFIGGLGYAFVYAECNGYETVRKELSISLINHLSQYWCSLTVIHCPCRSTTAFSLSQC